MNRPKGLDLWMYLRKSRADIEEERKAMEEGHEYDTLEKHRNHLLEVAKVDQHHIIDILSEVESGEFISERPKIQKILREIEAGHGDGVLCMDLDRLGRGDMVDQGTIYRVFKNSDALIVMPGEVINFDEDSAETLFSVRSLVAREELRMTTKRLQRGRGDSAKEGRSITNRVPYGYKRDENLKLQPDPETSWIVVKIFEMLASGMGRRAVALELDNMGIEPPLGNDRWDPSTIVYISQNEVYLGHIVWGKHKHIKQNGRYVRRKLPPEKWKRKNNAHPTIVSQELFDAANLAIQGRYRTPTVKTTGLKNPLASILKCAKCGKGMKYQNRRDGRKARIYCHNPYCQDQRSTIFEEVETAFIKGVEQIINTYESDAKPQRSNESIIPFKEKSLTKKEKDLADLRKQKNNLHDLLEQGVYDVQTFMDRQNVVSERIKAIKGEIENLQQDIKNERRREKQQYEFVPRMKTVLQAYHGTDDVEKKNQLLKSVIEKATFRRDKEWSKPGQLEIEIYPRIK